MIKMSDSRNILLDMPDIRYLSQITCIILCVYQYTWRTSNVLFHLQCSKI